MDLDKLKDLGYDINDKRVKKQASSTISLLYWLARGFTHEEAKIKINIEQKSRNRSCPDYYIKRGCSNEDAIRQANEYSYNKTKKMRSNCRRIKANNLVSEEERKTIVSNSSVRKINFWLLKGLSEDEAIEKVKSIQGFCGKQQKTESIEWRKTRYRLPEYWVDKFGFTMDDAIDTVSFIQKRNLDFFVNKFGVEIGKQKYLAMVNKRISAWKNKSFDEIAEHAKKTTSFQFNENSSEMKAIKMFIKQNDIDENYCMFGSAINQFYQIIPNVGFRRYDLAVFEDAEKSKLKIIFEYHGFAHVNFSEFNEDIRYEKFTDKNGKQLNFLPFIGESYDNDIVKRQHIFSKYQDVKYCVAWPENLKNKRMKINELQ